jgi:hypothetical protein
VAFVADSGDFITTAILVGIDVNFGAAGFLAVIPAGVDSLIQ